MNIKRRTFFFMPLLFPAVNSLANGNSKFDYSVDFLAPDIQELLKLLRNPLTAVELGRQYLLENPTAADKKFLKRTIGLDSRLNHTTESIKQQYMLRQRLDFEIGNIQCVDGWILSKAEVSLCALAAMHTLKA